MPAPPVELTEETATRELYDAMAPAFTEGDESRDWPLWRLCVCICEASGLEEVWDLVIDREDGTPGWQILFDPARCPAAFLPFLAQFAGARLRPDMDEQQQRDAISSPEVFLRGTPEQILAVAKRRLTGSKTALLTERYADNAYRIQLTTIEAETPDAAATTAELVREAKPIGVRLFFNATVPWTWAEVVSEFDSWADFDAAFEDWLEARTHVP